jgi:hypothetical protein
MSTRCLPGGRVFGLPIIFCCSLFVAVCGNETSTLIAPTPASPHTAPRALSGRVAFVLFSIKFELFAKRSERTNV